jgi:hypothetical protein
VPHDRVNFDRLPAALAVLAPSQTHKMAYCKLERKAVGAEDAVLVVEAARPDLDPAAVEADARRLVMAGLSLEVAVSLCPEKGEDDAEGLDHMVPVLTAAEVL